MSATPTHARLLAVGLALLLAPAPATAPGPAPAPLESVTSAESVEEYRLKAAFLYNFANFTTWPEDAFETSRSPLVFAVLGQDPFGEHLEKTLHEKHLNGRPLELVHFKKLDDLDDCHLLFISRSERKRVDEIHEELDGRAVFTVSDIDRYTHQGGVAHLGIEDQRPVMEINTSAAKRAGLSISSQLLKLARVIEDDG